KSDVVGGRADDRLHLAQALQKGPVLSAEDMEGRALWHPVNHRHGRGGWIGDEVDHAAPPMHAAVIVARWLGSRREPGRVPNSPKGYGWRREAPGAMRARSVIIRVLQDLGAGI